jgi:hypothetical protein
LRCDSCGEVPPILCERSEQIDKTAQLARLLGHPTSKAGIHIINSGDRKSPVSATNVRNNDDAKDMSIVGLLGNMTKRVSVLPGYVITLRVSLWCNAIFVDIIFVKKIAS